MDEQEEKNQSSSFEKQSHGKALSKLKDLQKKKENVKKITTLLKAKVVIIPLLIILGVVVFFVMWGGLVSIFIDLAIGDTNKAKKAAINTSYSAGSMSSQTGNQNDTTNGNSSADSAKIIVKPTENKDAYEITNKYTDDEIKNLREELEKETSRDISDFTDSEIAIIGALDENGLNIDDWNISELKCFPAFIKAEACTQYLDLRPNSQKFKDGKYVPEKVDKNGNKIPGVILVQRTNTNSNTPVTLEYMQESEFNKLVDANDEKAINYFTVNNKGNLVIAKWYMEEITVNGDYPENLPEIEKEKSTGKVYTINPEEIDYSQMIKNCTMPFELLVQLLAILEDPDFCMELADYAMESKIVLNIQEEETYMHTVEERTYTVHSKDEKRIDYQIASVAEIEKNENYLLLHDPKATDDKGNVCTNYEVNEKKVTVDRKYTSHTYGWGIVEADTWISHYTESYAVPTTKNETTSDTVKDLPNEYTQINTDKQPITDSNETIKDKDVKEFKDEKEEYYKNLITIPKVKLELGTKYIWDALAEQYIEIPGDNKITITPEDKIQSPWTSKEYKADEDLPSTINVTTKANGSLPQIIFPFALNNSNYATSYTKEQIAQCNVTKLDIKEFERIDTVNTKTEDVTRYESDSNPIKNVDLYDKTDEKFLKSYDKSKRAQHMMNSVSSWLFEAMEDDEATEKFSEVIKYLLYKYDGTDYGVTSLDTSMFEPGEFTNMSGVYGDALTEFIKAWENAAVWNYLKGKGSYNSYVGKYITQDKSQYIVYSEKNSEGTTWNFSYGINIGGTNSEGGGYADLFKKNGLNDPSTYKHEGATGEVAKLDAVLNDRIAADKQAVLNQVSGYNLSDEQIGALLCIKYQYGNISGFKESYTAANGDMNKFKDAFWVNTESGGIAYPFKSTEKRAEANWKLFSEGIYTDSAGNEIVARFNVNGGKDIIKKAEEVHTYMEQNGYKYGHTNGKTPSGMRNQRQVNCISFVTWVYCEAGIIDNIYISCAAFENEIMYGKYKDLFQKVDRYEDLQEGDIMYFGNNAHAEIYAGNGYSYNAGTDGAIAGNDPKYRGNLDRGGLKFAYGYRLKSINKDDSSN